MQPRLRVLPALAVLSILAAGAGSAHADGPGKPVAAAALVPPEEARKAIDRGLAFLDSDAEKWRTERHCATCHHGTMTVWALSEAKSQGYAVAAETLADVTKWTKERLENIDKPRDTRPGWNMVSTPAVYLAVMAQAVPAQDAVSPDDLKRIAGHLRRHQEADGSWAWSLAPAKNRPPPVFESDEVVTLMAYVALGPHVPADPASRLARDGRQRALAWLEKTKPRPQHAGHGLGLFRDVQAGKTPKELEPGDRPAPCPADTRTAAGARTRTSPATPYATGQALYFLEPGRRAQGPGARSGAVWRSWSPDQKEDGSWPMTSRAHPGRSP